MIELTMASEIVVSTRFVMSALWGTTGAPTQPSRTGSGEVHEGRDMIITRAPHQRAVSRPDAFAGASVLRWADGLGCAGGLKVAFEGSPG
jgi:hypothetical protein